MQNISKLVIHVSHKEFVLLNLIFGYIYYHVHIKSGIKLVVL